MASVHPGEEQNIIGQIVNSMYVVGEDERNACLIVKLTTGRMARVMYKDLNTRIPLTPEAQEQARELLADIREDQRRHQEEPANADAVQTGTPV